MQGTERVYYPPVYREGAPLAESTPVMEIMEVHPGAGLAKRDFFKGSPVA